MTKVYKYLFLIISCVLLQDVTASVFRPDIEDDFQWDTIADIFQIGTTVTDSDILALTSFLTGVLRSFQTRPLPMIYVEDISVENADPRLYEHTINKRQYLGNRPHTAERYICKPSREDIFKLMLALQDMRREGPNKAINFCNVKRPTGAIFTNIRLLRSRDISTPTPPR